MQKREMREEMRVLVEEIVLLAVKRAKTINRRKTKCQSYAISSTNGW